MSDFNTWQKSYQTQKERAHSFVSVSSDPIEPLYGPENTSPIDYQKDLSNPGEYPYTRGVRTNMYRGRFWTMRQFAGFGSAQESNERFKFLLSQGQTGLSVAFDERRPHTRFFRCELGRFFSAYGILITRY